MMGRATLRLAAWAAVLLVTGAPLALGAREARAQIAWVKDEVVLQLRTGPGTRYRNFGAVRTGDRVRILERGERWTKVRIPGREDGWVPAGYLQADPPARYTLEQREIEFTELRERADRLDKEVSELRASSESLTSRDDEQQQQIQTLTRENLELRAGARWPEWIAGACILTAGALIGAIWHRMSTRRPGPRIRL